MQALRLPTFTPQEVLEIQSRIVDLLQAVADQHQILLDPEVLWNDGVLAPPTLGEPWRLTLSSHGRRRHVTITAAEVIDVWFGIRSAQVCIRAKLEAELQKYG